ncbi:hypothetical protein WKW79_35155 [Variovorax robiniae]|uniref:Uncharacterized protein n=1 Tax=Variovorax robiniae TaxID=1836199 RepID=A0ABU8XL54_9BURK
MFVWYFRAEVARLIARVEKVKAGNVEATLGAAQQQAQAAKVEVTFPLPGEGPGETLDAPVPTGPAVQAQVPAQPQIAGEAQPDAIDWTISEEAHNLAPPVPGGDLQAVAQWVHRNPGPTVRDFIMVNAALRAERCFNLIFGTQVAALEYLRSLPGSHLMVDLLPFHERHVELMQVQPAISVPTYLSFLLNQGLIANVGPPEGPLYSLTPFGEHFLGYIKQYYPLGWDKRPL